MSPEDADAAQSPAIEVNGVKEEATQNGTAVESESISAKDGKESTTIAVRRALQRSGTSYNSLPPPGALLTGKQEHCMAILEFDQANCG